MCAVVYVLTMIALFWALTRRRRAADDRPETTRSLTRGVTAAAAVTIVILIAVAVVSFAAERGLVHPSGPGARSR